MTLPSQQSLSDLEKTYESAKLKLNNASQDLKKLEKACLLQNKQECLQKYDSVLHDLHNICKSRERVSLNCIKDCFSKINYDDASIHYDEISDPRDQMTFLKCKKVCLEDAISKIHNETKILKKSESDLKFNYLGNIV